MQIIAEREGFSYLSKQHYCILHYITDSIRLIPVCILLLPHWLCPDKSFFENTTLGVSHYETHRSRLRRRPRPHWCNCLHPDVFHLHPEQGHRRPHQHAADSDVRPRRSQCLRYGNYQVNSALQSETKVIFIINLAQKISPHKGHSMKNIVRAFVAVLVLTGAVASTQ